MSYLGNLTLRLAAGANSLPESLRQRHVAFLTALQQSDGGFAGRQGKSDPYYTSFGLRGLALLGALDASQAARAGAFLSRQLSLPLPPVDFLSLLYSTLLLELTSGVDVFAEAGRDRLEMMQQLAASLRLADGGYGKSPRSPHSSTYLTFLMVSALDLVGAPIDERLQIASLLRSRQRPDGGFVELPVLRHSGTNPTAAALGGLRIVDALDTATAAAAGNYFRAMQNAEGGVRANTRVPVADLLSTFTALAAVAGHEGGNVLDRAAVRRYVEGLEQDGGGFRAAAWDATCDVEYTFYGLGCLCLLG